MGRKLNLDHLSEEECEQVLKVIQRDFELRQKEQHRLGSLEHEITEEDTKAQIISKKPEFNESYCMRCFSRFFLIFNPKVQCKLCKYFTCKSCAEWDKKEKVYICKVCDKQSALQKESNEWFYNNVRERFKRFGSAKVVRSLYKRKTDSDSESEVWSRSLPNVYNSAPSDRGKRSRPSLSTAFSMNVDGAAKQVEDGEGMVEEDIIAQQRPLQNTSAAQYTCKLASGRPETFDEVKQAEVQQFQEQLDGIIAEVTRTLENQSAAGIPHGDVTQQQQYEKLLDNHRLQLSDNLSSMAQSLHIAIDNQNVNDPVRNPEMSSNPAARHQLVQQVQQQEVEAFLGHPINKNELSSQTSNGATGGLERSFEDVLANVVINKIVADYHESEAGAMDREEADLHRQLTKLHNKATVSQLNDMVSESETDGEITSPRSASDMDSRSELSELSIVTKGLDHSDGVLNGNGNGKSPMSSTNLSPLSPVLSDSQKSAASKKSEDSGIKMVDNGNKMATTTETSEARRQEVNNNTNGGTEMTRLWERVEGQTEPVPEIEDHWKRVEAKRSEVKDDDEDDDDTVKPSVTDESATIKHETHLETLKETIPKTQIVRLESVSKTPEQKTETETIPGVETVVEPAKIERLETVQTANSKKPESEMDSSDEDMFNQTDNSDTAAAADEIPLKPHDLPVFGERRNSVDNDDEFSAGLEFANKRRVPLPSFDNQEELAERNEVDLDDISRMEDDSDSELGGTATSTLSSQVSFGPSFANNSLFTDRSRISAYDNYGDKKVGYDNEGPVFMFVPKSGERLRVGDRDIDDLSDLSENEVGSEDFSDDVVDLSEEDEDEQGGYFDDEGHFITGRKPKMAAKDGRRRRRSQSRSELEDTCVGTDDLEEFIRQQNEEKERKEQEEQAQKVQANVTAASPTSPEDPNKLNKLASSELIDEETDEDEESDPAFLSRPMKRISVTEGEPVTFECEVNGSKPIDVFWYKDMVEIFDLADDDRCELSTQNGKHAITMFNTTKSDAGPYLCIAVNEQGQCSRHFKLTVKDNSGDQSAPEFLKPLSDVEITEGQFVKLKVKVKGYPQPRIVWYKDGKKIKADEQFRFEKLGNRDYVLAIEYVSLEEDAEYTVIAKNIAGEAKTRCQLIVEPKQEDSSMARSVSMESARSSTSSSWAAGVDSSLYPETSDLMRLAQQVQAKRGHVTETATDMVQSADQMSSLHRQLDVMDRKLDNMEGEVSKESWTTERNGNYATPSRQQVIQEQRDMKRGVTIYGEETKNKVLDQKEPRQAAAQIRSVTNRALDILADEKSPTTTKTTTEFIDPAPTSALPDLDEEVELRLSYAEYERLYTNGIVRRQQIQGGKCKRRDFIRIREFLQENMTQTERDQFDRDYDIVLGDDYASAVDCGLKRVDSKRYKREYEVNREGKMKSTPKWEVQLPTSPTRNYESMEVIPSTPAGRRADPIQEIAMNEAEDQIYVASGRVFGLEDRARDLERQINDVDEDDSHAAREELKRLEDEVARTVAQVNTAEDEVTGVEGLVRSMRQQYDQQRSSQPNQPSPRQRVLSSSSSINEPRSRSNSQQQYQQQQQRVVSPPPVAASSVSQVQSQPPPQRKYSFDAPPPPLPSSPPPNQQQLSFTGYSGAGAKPRSSSFQEGEQVVAQEPRRQSLKGELREDAIPESRVEVDKTLPSVKNLLSRFKEMETPEPQGSGVKRTNDYNKAFNKVYSLTGRDLPPSVRQKMRNQKPFSPVSNIRIASPDTFKSVSRTSTPSADEKPPRRLSSSSDSEFSPIKKHTMTISPSASSEEIDFSSASLSSASTMMLSSSNKSKDHTSSSNNISSSSQHQPSYLATSATTSNTSSSKTNTPNAKSNPAGAYPKTSYSPAHPSKNTNNQSPRSPTSPTPSAGLPKLSSAHKAAAPQRRESLDAPKRNKNSAIMARAAFWDKKITDGEDTEFPEMPEESFKRSDDLSPRQKDLLSLIDKSHVDMLREKQHDELNPPDIKYNLVVASWEV